MVNSVHATRSCVSRGFQHIVGKRGRDGSVVRPYVEMNPYITRTMYMQMMTSH